MSVTLRSAGRRCLFSLGLVSLLNGVAWSPVSGAISWSSQLDPNLSTLLDPTIKQLWSDDFDLGFKFTGVSDIRNFNTLQTTATGARYNAAGDLQWAAYLDGGAGSRHQRIVPLEDLNHFFAAYTTGGRIRLGMFHGETLEQRFGHELDRSALSDSHQVLNIGLYGGDVVGVAQHLGDEVRVLLLDKQGDVLSDRAYAGFFDPFNRPPVLALQRLPDLSGFLLMVGPNYVVCLENDGSVRWAKAGGGGPNDIPPSIGPDGSVLFTAAIPRVGNFPDGATYLLKLNADGSLAWARIIYGFLPITDYWILGRNPVYDGDNVWLTGGTPAGELNDFNFAIDGTYLGLMRLDGASGEILAQADLVITNRSIFIAEFSAWNGNEAFFAVECIVTGSGPEGNILKVDGNLENPTLLQFSYPVETTRISYDHGSDSLLYTASAFNGGLMQVVSIDADTLIPGHDCNLFSARDFSLAPANRVVEPFPTPIMIVDAGIAVTNVSTVLSSVDLPVEALAMNEATLCPGGPQPPRPPELQLVIAPGSNLLSLTFLSQTNVTYDILFADSLAGPFETMDSLPGTGGELSYQTTLNLERGQGYYQVRAARDP